LSEEYKEKLRSLGFVKAGSKSSTRLTRVDREDGTIAGTEREHWDGRVDGTAMPRTIHMRTKMEEGER
jgi:hypothetical protein